MTTGEQRKLIRNKIESGACPQQVYDELHGPGNAADEKLADAVRYMPTMERRAKYRTGHYVLMGLLLLAAGWNLSAWAYVQKPVNISMVPMAIFGLGYLTALFAVAKYWRRAHAYASLLAFLEVMQSRNLPQATDATGLLPVLLLGATAVLAMWLQRELTPDYILLKEHYKNADGQARMRRVVRFGD